MLKKNAWIALAVCCSVVVGGVVWANWNHNEIEASSQSKEDRYSFILSQYEEQKQIANAPDASTEDEQKLKELTSEVAAIEEENNPKSPREEFEETFAGYKDLYAIESAMYADKQNSTDPLDQKVLHELEEKGKLIMQFENAAKNKMTVEDTLLQSFYEATDKLNRELYPERYE